MKTVLLLLLCLCAGCGEKPSGRYQLVSTPHLVVVGNSNHVVIDSQLARMYRIDTRDGFVWYLDNEGWKPVEK